MFVRLIGDELEIRGRCMSLAVYPRACNVLNVKQETLS